MSILRKKRRRVALRQFPSVEAFREEVRRMTADAVKVSRPPMPRPSPEAGTIRPALTRVVAQPATLPAYYGEHCCPNCYPVVDWNGVVFDYPYDSDEQPPTGWNGVATMASPERTQRWAR